MDGELSSEAGRFLARRMGSEEELGAAWQRYHLIRDCLRRPGERFAVTRLEIDLAELDGETASSLPGHGRPGWLRPVAGTAIAASVAAAAVFLSLNLGQAPATPAAEPFASPNSAGIAPVSAPASLRAESAASQRSLNRYVLRHNQAANAVGQQGFVSFVPIVATAPVQVIEPAEESADEEAADTGDQQP